MVQTVIVNESQMPLHEVVVRQSYFDQEVINRYNYVSSGTPAAVTLSFGLVAAMGYILQTAATQFDTGTMANAIQLGQASGLEYVDVLARDVYDPLDFYTTSFPAGIVGQQSAAGDAMSPAIAYGFRSARTRLDIKRGFKRFAGVTEGNVEAGGNILGSFLVGRIAIIATKLGELLTYDDEGNVLTYQPVIVSKFKYTTPNGNPAYRYYEDTEGGEAEQLLNVADANVWQGYNQVRTQVSRQYGRGR